MPTLPSWSKPKARYALRLLCAQDKDLFSLPLVADTSWHPGVSVSTASSAYVASGLSVL